MWSDQHTVLRFIPPTSDVAGLRRAVLDSVGRYLLLLVADNEVCNVYACPKCGAIVHAKRAVCDCGHAFACKRRHVAVMIVSLRKLRSVEEPLSVKK